MILNPGLKVAKRQKGEPADRDMGGIEETWGGFERMQTTMSRRRMKSCSNTSWKREWSVMTREKTSGWPWKGSRWRTEAGRAWRRGSWSLSWRNWACLHGLGRKRLRRYWGEIEEGSRCRAEEDAVKFQPSVGLSSWQCQPNSHNSFGKHSDNLRIQCLITDVIIMVPKFTKYLGFLTQRWKPF